MLRGIKGLVYYDKIVKIPLYIYNKVNNKHGRGKFIITT